MLYHDRQRVGDLSDRVTFKDVAGIDKAKAELSVLIPNVTMLVGIVVVMFVVDPGFALSHSRSHRRCSWCFVSTRRIKRASKIARRKESDIASVASETLSAIHVVQAYTTEDRHAEPFREHNVERLRAGLDAVRL